MDESIESLFDDLCIKYLKPEMEKYIKMDLFRKDFTDGVKEIIVEFSEPDSDAEGYDDEDELRDRISESVSDLPFGFDSSDAIHDTDFDAQTEIENFILNILKN